MTEQEKLEISCGKVDCENGLHCYRVTKTEATRAWNQSRLGSHDGRVNQTVALGLPVSEIPVDEQGKPKEGPLRVCKACGACLVDWSRVHMQNLGDVEYTFKVMKTEWIRHRFWHWPLDDRTKTYAYKKGSIGLRERVKTRIHKYVGRAPASELWHDGRQTPFALKPDAENVIYCAQHATASCCRKCVELWHKIPPDRALTEAEEEYLTELAMRYILDRLPSLTPEGGPRPAEDSSLRAANAPDAQVQPATSVAGHSTKQPAAAAFRAPSANGAASRRLATRRRSSKPQSR